MRRPARAPQREPRCDAVTDLTRSLESVPPGARWRVSWAVSLGGGRSRRVVAYLFNDSGAAKWCAGQGIAFVPLPGPLLLDAPASCAHEPCPASSPHDETGSAVLDVRERAAGDRRE